MLTQQACNDAKRAVEGIVARAKENPNLLNIETDFELTRPELRVTIDRERAADLDITVEDVGLTLQTMLASRQNCLKVSLGPRILRADTAAIAALSCYQSICGDWNGKMSS